MAVRRISELPVLVVSNSNDGSSDFVLSAFNESFMEVSYQMSPIEPRRYASRALRMDQFLSLLQTATEDVPDHYQEHTFHEGATVDSKLTVNGDLDMNANTLQSINQSTADIKFKTFSALGYDNAQLSCGNSYCKVTPNKVILSQGAEVEKMGTTDNSIVTYAYLDQQIKELQAQIDALKRG